MKRLLSLIEKNFTFVLLGVVLGLGGLGSAWIITNADRQMRADLLLQERLATQVLNIESIKALSGTEADLALPVYQDIKQLLISMRTVDPQYRFIYLMGQKSDGTVFMFVDSEPSDSADYSPPGQLYLEASEGILRVFGSKAAVVDGPVADRWGTWVSPLLPLLDPVTGQIVAVVGMDIEGDAWNWNLVNRAGLPVGLLLALLLLGFTTILFYHTNKLVQHQQAKLQESDKQFRSMFNDHSAVMLLVEPKSGRILDANGAASQFYGYPIDKIKSMNIDQINCMDPAQIAAEREKALRQQKNYFNFQHKLASGEIREVEIYSTPIDFDGGTVLFSILHDVTERNRIEQARQDEKEAMERLLFVSEEFLGNSEMEIDFQKITDSLLQISGGQYVAFNLFEENGRDFQTVAVSGLSEHFEKVTSILGFKLRGKKWPYDEARAAKTRDHVITRFDSLFDLVGDALPKAALLILKRLFNPGEVVVAKIPTREQILGDFTIIMPGGVRFAADNIVFIYLRQVGLLLRRKQAESRLWASQQLYRQLVEQVPEVIYTDEIGGSWRYLGPNIQVLCGYSAEELIAEPGLWMSRIPEQDRARLQADISALAVGDVLSSEYRIQRRDGVVIWVRDHGVVKEDRGRGRAGTGKSEDGGKLIQGLLGDITQQKEIETEKASALIALHKSEERFRQLAEVFPETIFEADLSGKVTYTNAHGYQNFGMTEADVAQGVNIMDMVIPEDRQTVGTRIRERVAEASSSHAGSGAGMVSHAGSGAGMVSHAGSGAGMTSNLESTKPAVPISGFLEYKALRKNGESFDVMGYSVPIRSEGQITGIRGFILDISERKRTELALMESESNFRTFFETIDDIIVVGTPQGEIRFGNAALYRKLGYSQEELRGMQILELHPADRRQEAEAIFAAMFRGERDSCPLPLAAKNGTLVPVETRVWFGRWSGEECIFGVCKDLSAEQEAQQRFERLFRNNPTLMALSSMPDRKFSDVNNAFLSTLGYAAEEILGKTSAEIGLFVNRDQQNALAEQLKRSGSVADFELQIRRKDGKILDGLFSGEMIINQGKTHFLTVMIDITERKRVEDALRQQSHLQQLLMEISSTYINLPLDEVAATIQASLGDLAQFVEADRVYIFDYDFGKQICKNTYEWCAEGIEPQIAELQAVPLVVLPDWVSAHLRGEAMVVADVLALAPGGLKDILEAQSIRSLLAVPLIKADSCLGFVGFDWVKQHHSVSEMEYSLLTMFATMLVNIRLRKEAEAALRDREARFYSLFDNSPISLWEEDFSAVKQRLDALRTEGVVDFEAYLTQHPEVVKECIAMIKVLNVNKATLNLHGVADMDGILDNMAAIFPAEEIKYFQTELVQIASGVSHFEVETVNRTLSGNRIEVNLNWAVIPGYENDLSKVIVSLINITERKQAETALRESEAKIRAIADSAQDAILMLDPQGLISYWNPGAERIFGYTGFDAIGQNLHDLIAPQAYHEAHHAAFPTFVETGQGAAIGKSLELAAIRRDGVEIPVQLSLSSFQMDGSWYAVGILSDISERKMVEAEILETNRQLEESITRANTFAVQAEIANIAKSEFLANMSHEIRTPMNGVIGMTGLLLDTKLDEEQRRFAEIVRSSAEALLTLINDILDFSKIEAGKLDLETLDFDLLSMLDDFAATVAMRAHEKGLELLCAADVGVPALLRGDPGRLRQILNNLVGNAIKFTHQGEVVVRVTRNDLGFSNDDLRFRTSKPGHDVDDFGHRSPGTTSEIPAEKASVLAERASVLAEKASVLAEKASVLIPREHRDGVANQIELRFSIRDTGIGIPSDKLSLLFNKFSQVDASTTRQFGGTGLGLVISKQLAELMGGSIGVNSEPGRGSEFWFTVRLGLQPESASGKESETPALGNLKNVRVLVVDDNATSRDILYARLASWGMRSEEAIDGAAALKALTAASEQDDPFRFAILDMQMPGMDGAALGQAIKNDEHLSETLLVLLSSLGERGDARKFAQIGFSGYLTKPMRHTDLFNVLSTALAGMAVPAEARSLVTRHSAREFQRVGMGAGTRILLAEDNITNQKVALGILAKFGLRADAAANGIEALRALETIPYDLVLMDVQMPEMDGLAATRSIRDPQSAVLNHAIPIIAMTAHAMQSDRQRCLDAGMNDYVSKPVDPQALAAAIERWLGGEGDGRQGTGKGEDGGKGEGGGAGTEKSEDGVSSVFGLQSSDMPQSSDIPQPSVTLFDKAALTQRLMGDDELTRVVLAGFLEDIPLQIQALKDYLKAGDVKSVERQAHTIKGAAANIGGEALRVIAFELEKMGKSGDLDTVRKRMDELELQFERLKDVLEKEV